MAPIAPACLAALFSIPPLSDVFACTTTTKAWCARISRRVGFIGFGKRTCREPGFSIFCSRMCTALQLVKPSLQETAAWLAIWDPDVAREVIHREPYLLLTGGDPASLPPDVRASALTRVVERMVANDENLPILDYDSVKRFARPDIAPVIRQLWPIHKHHEQARDLLLRLIWLGELRECADLAAEAVAAPHRGSRYDQVVAGRAFMATADNAKKAAYVARNRARLRLAPTNGCLGCRRDAFSIHSRH